MAKKAVKPVLALLSPVGYWVRKNLIGSTGSAVLLDNVKPGAHLLIVRLNRACTLLPLSPLENRFEAVVEVPQANGGSGGPIRRDRVRRDGVLGYGGRRGGGRRGGAGPGGRGRAGGGGGGGAGGGGAGGGQFISCNNCRIGCRYRHCPCKRAGRRCVAQCRCLERSHFQHCHNGRPV